MWKLWNTSGVIVGAIMGETVRQWPKERLRGWLNERNLPLLPKL